MTLPPQPLLNAQGNESQSGARLQGQPSLQDAAGPLVLDMNSCHAKWRSEGYIPSRILALCNSAGATSEALLPTSDAAQAPQANPDEIARAPASPVLLVFACGEEGQQHAEALHDAVSRHKSGVQLVSGFQIFTAVQSMESSPVQFQSGVLLACLEAWQACQSNQGSSFVAALQLHLAKAERYVAAAQSKTKQVWANVKFSWEASDHYEEAARSFEETFGWFVKQACSQSDLNKWGSHRLSIAAGSELGDLHVTAGNMSSAAGMEAVVISRLEPCSALQHFLPSFNSKDCNLLTQMMSKLQCGDVEKWQQAALAAFLVQDPREIAEFNVLVHESRVELLVTLALQCTKITLSQGDYVNGLYANGELAQCDVSVQLYAYASRQMQGELMSYTPWCVPLTADPLYQQLVDHTGFVHSSHCIGSQTCDTSMPNKL